MPTKRKEVKKVKKWEKVLLFLLLTLIVIFQAIGLIKEKSKEKTYTVCYINGDPYFLATIDPEKNYIEVGDKLYINPVVVCKK